MMDRVEELNREVSEKVFGQLPASRTVLKFASDIAEAWKVVHAMALKGYPLNLSAYDDYPKSFDVTFRPGEPFERGFTFTCGLDAIPDAICSAAVAALREPDAS